jgi:hypothetical protein
MLPAQISYAGSYQQMGSFRCRGCDCRFALSIHPVTTPSHDFEVREEANLIAERAVPTARAPRCTNTCARHRHTLTPRALTRFSYPFPSIPMSSHRSLILRSPASFPSNMKASRRRSIFPPFFGLHKHNNATKAHRITSLPLHSSIHPSKPFFSKPLRAFVVIGYVWMIVWNERTVKFFHRQWLQRVTSVGAGPSKRFCGPRPPYIMGQRQIMGWQQA